MRTESTHAIARLEMLYFCMASKKNTVFALQNPKLALPLQCLLTDRCLSRRARLLPIHIEGHLLCPDIYTAIRLPSVINVLGDETASVSKQRIGSRFSVCLAYSLMQYERIDPVGHTTPRPSRDPHRSQIPGPVHNPVARTPRRGHAAHADAVTHPHRRSRPLGSRGHVVLAGVRHDGRSHAVAHAGRVVGCRPRLGSIGITDINNGRR